MSTSTAAIMTGPHKPIEVRDVDMPALERGAAILDVDLSEICGTDVHLLDGRLAGVPYPIVPGHVTVGRIRELGGDQTDIAGRPLSVGQAVTFLDVYGSCGHCWYCLVAKATTRCPKRTVYGITMSIDRGPAGGWAAQMYLRPGTKIIPLDGVPPERYMAGGCSLPTALHAIERADITIGQTLLVLGSGPVGLSVVALARLSGAGKVLCIGAPAARCKMAADIGANDTLDIETHDADARREWVYSHTDGRGADITIEATGRPEAVVQAMRWTRDAGRVIVVGQYTDHGEVSFNPHVDLNRKHLEIRGVWGSDYSHFQRAVDVLRQTGENCPWDRIRCDRFGLREAAGALEAVRRGEMIKALIDPSK